MIRSKYTDPRTVQNWHAREAEEIQDFVDAMKEVSDFIISAGTTIICLEKLLDENGIQHHAADRLTIGSDAFELLSDISEIISFLEDTKEQEIKKDKGLAPGMA